MSIGGLIDQFGKCLFVYRPDFTVASDGQSARAYSREFTIHGFIQPGSQSSDVAQGRENGRTTTTIYVEGCSDVRIADEIHDKVSGTDNVRTWRVTGVVNPGFLGDTGAAAHLNHTEIECVEVEPEVSL